AYAYSITGFINNDPATVVSGVPTITSSATIRATKTYGVTLYTANVGNYTLYPTWGSLRAANYTFSFKTASLSITPSTQILTVTANNQTISHGSAIPKLTYRITGFLGWDTQPSQTSGTPSITTTAVKGSPKGTYTI